MKKYTICILAISLITVAGSFTTRYSLTDDVVYPAGYRKWTHVKSNFLTPEHANVHYRGFNHVYANGNAMVGYETGFFPDGSVIVFDVLEAVPNEKNSNYIQEAKHDHIDVMVRDSLKYAATGGWNYGQFETDNSPRQLTAEVKTQCFNCHAKQKDYVFSTYRP
jgi:hypothetical protein